MSTKWKSSDLPIDLIIILTEKSSLASVADTYKWSDLIPKIKNRPNLQLNTCQYLSMLASSEKKMEKNTLK